MKRLNAFLVCAVLAVLTSSGALAQDLRSSSGRLMGAYAPNGVPETAVACAITTEDLERLIYFNCDGSEAYTMDYEETKSQPLQMKYTRLLADFLRKGFSLMTCEKKGSLQAVQVCYFTKASSVRR